jgi:hypothetical protein
VIENEWTLQLIASFKFIWLAIFTYLYGAGGIKHKPTRRYYGTLWLTLGYVVFSLINGGFSFYYLICYPLLIAATSIGYGADTTGKKIFKRFYCGLAYAFAALPLAIVTSNWVMFALHTLLCLSISITLGVTNPVHARSEETLIGASIGLLPLFMV